MEQKATVDNEISLEKVITTAVQIPGVKVNREAFLAELFKGDEYEIQDILNFGPVDANVPQEKLASMANTLILKRTSMSSVASFVSGIPGGLAMAATIPADLMQFFGVALRLSQELAYLYGAQDMWQDGKLDDERVQNQLLLYCGVMFGVSGAVSGIRVLSTQIAKTAAKKLPQKALTKTFWYPMVKQIGKFLSIKVTKTTVARGVSKAIPIVGGVISGGLNFASMMPMANRLQAALESASFNYSEEEFEEDINTIESIEEENMEAESNKVDLKSKLTEGRKKAVGGISGLFTKKKSSDMPNSDDVFESIKKLSELKDSGIITQEEFESKKAELLAKI